MAHMLAVHGTYGPDTGYESLRHMHHLRGRMIITDDSAPLDLSALQHLKTIDELEVTDTTRLRDLDFLPQLVATYKILIRNNTALLRISSLHARLRYADIIIIERNPQLAEISLPQLVSPRDVSGSDRVHRPLILIDHNYGVRRIAFDGLAAWYGTMEISRNPNLVTITGMSQLTSIANVLISGNDSLTTIHGFYNTRMIQEFIVRDCAALNFLGNFIKLSMVDIFTIAGCPALESIRGLRSLDTVTEAFTISGSPASTMKLLASFPYDLQQLVTVVRAPNATPERVHFSSFVLAMICSHLNLLEILRLSRVNRQWYAYAHAAVQYRGRLNNIVTIRGYAPKTQLLERWSWPGIRLRLEKWPRYPSTAMVPHIIYYQPTSDVVRVFHRQFPALAAIDILDLAPEREYPPSQGWVTSTITDDDLPYFAKFKQLNLGHVSAITNVAPLSRVQTLDLSECINVRDLEPLASVQTLVLDGMKENWEFSRYQRMRLANLRTLSLRHCYNVADVSMFAGVRTLDLGYCRMVSDVSALHKIHTLSLEHCTNVSDVSMLGGVHSLNLNGCINITDVSALHKVHTLGLSGCYGVRDVSMLGGVHTLDLTLCINITDVSALHRVHTLILHNTRVSDVSALGRVHTLDLSMCRNVSDVSALGGVHTLNLSDTTISDVSQLGTVYNLNLNACFSIPPGSVKYLHSNTILSLKYVALGPGESLWPLRNAHTLNLAHTNVSSSDVIDLGNVHTLDLHDTPVRYVWVDKVHTLNLANTSVENVSYLGHVHTLNLRDCRQLNNLSGLQDVNTLILDDNYIRPAQLAQLAGARQYSLSLRETNIADVSGLAGVRHLDLTDCANVTDISSLTDVQSLNIRRCIRVSDITGFSPSQLVDFRGTAYSAAMNDLYAPE